MDLGKPDATEPADRPTVQGAAGSDQPVQTRTPARRMATLVAGATLVGAVGGIAAEHTVFDQERFGAIAFDSYGVGYPAGGSWTAAGARMHAMADCEIGSRQTPNDECSVAVEIDTAGPEHCIAIETKPMVTGERLSALGATEISAGFKLADVVAETAQKAGIEKYPYGGFQAVCADETWQLIRGL